MGVGVGVGVVVGVGVGGSAALGVGGIPSAAAPEAEGTEALEGLSEEVALRIRPTQDWASERLPCVPWRAPLAPMVVLCTSVSTGS